MSKMKVDEFIKKLKEVSSMNTIYKLGSFGNEQKNGNYCWDCSGLIKGILWGYPKNGKYKSNNVPDINANTLITKCTNVTTNINKVKIGYMLHMDGHCGVYIGNGMVIESSPKWKNGVQKTNINSRKWTKCGALPYIDYTNTNTNTAVSELNNAISVIAKYVKSGYFGNGHDNRKDKIYELVRKEVNK